MGRIATARAGPQTPVIGFPPTRAGSCTPRGVGGRILIAVSWRHDPRGKTPTPPGVEGLKVPDSYTLRDETESGGL